MDIEKLRRIRAAHRGVVTKLINSYNSTRENPQRVKKLLENKLGILSANTSEILALLESSEEIEDEIAQHSQYEADIMTCIVKCDKVGRGESAGSESSGRSSVALPKLQLTKYDGSFAEFANFWEMFITSIHRSNSLKDVEKFSYLKSYLTGAAQKCIQGLSLTNENYPIALELLEGRFGNKQAQINAHTTRLLHTRSVQSMELGALRAFYDHVQVEMRSLETLGFDPGSFDKLLLPMLLEKIPEKLKLKLAKNAEDSELWKLQDLMSLLLNEITSREKCNSRTNRITPPNHSMSGPASTQSRATMSTMVNKSGNPPSRTIKCYFCDGSHLAHQCVKYKTVAARRARISERNLCYACLGVGHRLSTCERTCRCCGGKHHAAICYNNMPEGPNLRPSTFFSQNSGNRVYNKNQPTTAPYQRNKFNPLKSHSLIEQNKNNTLKQTTSMHVQVPQTHNILMETGRTYCYSTNGKGRMINILFDKGSQRSYITENLFNELRLVKLAVENCKINVFGTHQSQNRSCAVVEVPLATERGRFTISALVVPILCNKLNQSCDPYFHSNLKGLDVKNANISGNIDVLIGLDYYWDMITGEIRNKARGLVALGSRLGWIISGRKDHGTRWEQNCEHSLVCHLEPWEPVIDQAEVRDTLAGPVRDTLTPESPDDADVKEYVQRFTQSLTYREQRYIVKLPWREGLMLSSNYLHLAQQRLQNLLKRLKQINMFQEYHNIFDTYISKGYIEPVSIENVRCFLPHHAVVRTDKATTKLRVVFDGSATSNKSLSINECLYKGPSLLSRLTKQLLNFRLSEYIIIADIQEAFLQISIDEMDRNYLGFLWVDAKENLVAYRFCRMPFGLSCSPFLLNATLQHHLRLHAPEFQTNFYVDDLIIQAASIEDGHRKIDKVNKALEKGGFHLRKWTSNCQAIVDQLPELGERQTKVLGIDWNATSDELSLVSLNWEERSKLTKRQVLSSLSKLFDPLGLFACVTIRLRMMFQELCSSEIGWDDAVTVEYAEKFIELMREVNQLTQIRLKRYLLVGLSQKQSEIHVFCDASQRALGAIIYVRYRTTAGYACSLLCSRARVAPIKAITIPKLELSAAIIGAKLYLEIIQEPTLKDMTAVFWTDSMATLIWITGTKQWPVYIENRVKLIRSMGIADKWRYIDTQQNPADIISRGANVTSMKNSSLWWHGPSFLQQPVPIAQLEQSPWENTDIQAEETISTMVSMEVSCPINIQKFSNYDKLCRILAYMLRFVRTTRKHEARSESVVLTLREINEAEMLLLKVDQHLWYPEIVQELRRKTDIKQHTTIKKLDLWIDEKGIVRVGTRLGYTTLSKDTRYPILLHYKSYLTNLIVRKYHEQLLHTGSSMTLANVRARFWIVRGRQVVKSIVNKCVKCRKFLGKPYSGPPPPPLPRFRLEESYPFVNVGIDFAGPLLVKANITVRNNKYVKAYICLFTCATTRAVHLELTLDLTCESFIDAYKRFVSRRGTPSIIYSDNGKTFVGAAKKLANIINGVVNKERVQHFLGARNVKWTFIVPRAPWWGGFYERMVGIVKAILKRVVGNALLNYIELETILIEIEGVINDRPLMYVSEDTEVISPSKLILGRTHFDTVLSDHTASTSEDLVRRQRHQRVMRHHFWKQFRKDYLTSLRERYSKGQPRGHAIKVGDVVHVYDEGPRLHWKLGEVTELFKGRDDQVRAAKVRLPPQGKTHTSISRAINHLYPLEINSNCDEKQSETTQAIARSRSQESTRGENTRSSAWGTLLIVLIVLPLIATKNTSICTNLNCFESPQGQLLFYNIYEIRDWIQMPGIVCSRFQTSCNYNKDLFLTKSKNCKRKFVKLSGSACRDYARTNQTLDGNLAWKSQHVASTNNSMLEQYAWLRTLIDRRWNTIIERHVVFTNGLVVRTHLETLQKCRFDRGECSMENKVLAWSNDHFCALKPVTTEMCHHRINRVVCSDSDFDVNGTVNMCGVSYLTTEQGLLLQLNGTKIDSRNRRHKLNAAVFQHLEDKVEELTARLQCIAQNQYCVRLNEVVNVRHYQYHKFAISSTQEDVDEETVDDVIHQQEMDIQGGNETKVEIQSVLSSIPKWIKLAGGIVASLIGTSMLIGVLFAIIKCGLCAACISICRTTSAAGVPLEMSNLRTTGSRTVEQINHTFESEEAPQGESTPLSADIAEGSHSHVCPKRYA